MCTNWAKKWLKIDWNRCPCIWHVFNNLRLILFPTRLISSVLEMEHHSVLEMWSARTTWQMWPDLDCHWCAWLTWSENQKPESNWQRHQKPDRYHNIPARLAIAVTTRYRWWCRRKTNDSTCVVWRARVDGYKKGGICRNHRVRSEIIGGADILLRHTKGSGDLANWIPRHYGTCD